MAASPTSSKAGTPDYYKRSPALLHRLRTDPKDDLLLVQHRRDAAPPVSDIESPNIACERSGRGAVLTLYGGVRRENPLYVAPLADVVAGRPPGHRGAPSTTRSPASPSTPTTCTC